MDTEKLLDKYIGPLPNQVFMLGALYTPLEFAHSVCTDDEYIALTSFKHHPYGQRFSLEVPDNYFHNTFLNVPLDTMMNRIVQSLRSGHPVCWEGDISEPGFLFGNGFAVLKHEDKKVTAERRQASFEAHRTTDDHVMEIVGLAHNQHGRRFFLCKNSWGTANSLPWFYCSLSENYVRMKTIAVVLRAYLIQIQNKVIGTEHSAPIFVTILMRVALLRLNSYRISLMRPKYQLTSCLHHRDLNLRRILLINKLSIW